MGMLKRVVNEALVTRLTSVSSKTHPSSSGISHLIPKGWAIRPVKIYCPHFFTSYTGSQPCVVGDLENEIINLKQKIK